MFDAAVDHVRALGAAGKKVVIAAWTEGSRDRLRGVFAEHGLKRAEPVGTLGQALGLPAGATALAVMGLEHGFEAGDLAVVGEQDILGDRLIRSRKKARRGSDMLQEVAALSAGDLVVHVDHGIGRFVGLQAIEVGEAPHDCLELHYAGGDKLFLPVENLELLSRYGSDESDAPLDRLGSASWQGRKARMKKRIREIAHGLIKIAAERSTKPGLRLVPPEGLYDEFCARFPYNETEDQAASIEAVIGDLASGHPMDRLVCGDVGFGKTEVALRAAFATAINGNQVAVVVPTTLLARQHFQTFVERFAGLPIQVGQISRMIPAAEQKRVKAGLADGSVDIVVGTHALLGKTIAFKDLGLVVIDEEQRFGVSHKERLKDLRAEVHILTLSATPIPRTLQLAMTGVRDLSIIATPPVDRLAVRTSVFPFDELIIREALLRERYRGGQSFYVCPRIEDLEEAASFLSRNVPEVKFVVAHGQMSPTELEDKMSAFYEGKYDVLLATAIVEAGLDIPRANTLIVHRADLFGLAQLYQLRGRVGRSKNRAYALFTLPADKPPTAQAEKRLKVLQTLDTLGAGFELASHDLDIRGRRQPARRRAVGPHQGGRLRALPADAARRDRCAAGRHRGGGRGDLVALDHCRRSRNDSGTLRRRSRAPHEPLSAAVGPGGRGGDREFRCRDDRSVRAHAGRGAPIAQADGREGPVPARPCRAGRCGTEGRRHRLSGQQLQQPAGAGALRAGPENPRQGAARHAGCLHARVRSSRGSAGRHARGPAHAGQPGGEEGGLTGRGDLRDQGRRHQSSIGVTLVRPKSGTSFGRPRLAE